MILSIYYRKIKVHYACKQMKIIQGILYTYIPRFGEDINPTENTHPKNGLISRQKELAREM